MENKKRWRQCGQNGLARVWPRLGSVSDCEAHLEGVAANPRGHSLHQGWSGRCTGGQWEVQAFSTVLRKLSKYVYFIQNWNFCGAFFSFTGFVVTFLHEYGIKINFSLEQGPFFSMWASGFRGKEQKYAAGKRVLFSNRLAVYGKNGCTFSPFSTTEEMLCWHGFIW